MVRLTLLGMQGSGKGTYGRQLAETRGLDRIVIGDLVRHRAQAQDETGIAMAEAMARGELVDASYVEQALAEGLERTGDAGFVLDGFPRQPGQADRLDVLLAVVDMRLDAAVYLEIDETTARRRLEARVVCTSCGHASRVEVHPEGAGCPRDGCVGSFCRRGDDSDTEAVDRRLAEFSASIEPLLADYRRSGRLVVVDATQPEPAVWSQLTTALDRF